MCGCSPTGQTSKPSFQKCNFPDDGACGAHVQQEPRSCSINSAAVFVFQNELDVPFTVKAGQIGEFLPSELAPSEQAAGRDAVIPQKPVSETAAQPTISTFKQPEKSASSCLVQPVKTLTASWSSSCSSSSPRVSLLVLASQDKHFL